MTTGVSVFLNKYQEIIGMTLVPIKHIRGMTECPNCGEYKLSHRVCKNCGSYNGEEVVSK